MSRCTTAHPIHTRFANILGASIKFSEATQCDRTLGPDWDLRSLGQEEGELTLRLDPAEAGGAAQLAEQVQPGATLSFRTVVGCHYLAVYTVILLSLWPFSVEVSASTRQYRGLFLFAVCFISSGGRGAKLQRELT